MENEGAVLINGIAVLDAICELEAMARDIEAETGLTPSAPEVFSALGARVRAMVQEAEVTRGMLATPQHPTVQ